MSTQSTCTTTRAFAGEASRFLMDPKSELDRLTDAVYLVYDGNRNGRGCQIVFLHGLQVNHEQEEDAAYLRNCWSSRDGCELWPKWLAGSFPRASIYLVKYNSRLHEDDKNRQLDMHIIAEGILSNLLLANIGQSPTNPVILVGQDIGGLVIKEICLQASRHLGEETRRLFSQQVKGIVYYSTPHLGVRMQFGDCKFDAKLAKDPLNVEEATAPFDVDIFCPIDASAIDICRPEDRFSLSFGQLGMFIKETMFGNRNASRPRRDFKEDPKYVHLPETSNNIRSWLADPKRQVVVLVGDAGTWKSGVAKYLALQYDMEMGPEAEFWDGVFYVDCGRGANTTPILRRLLRQLKVQESRIVATEDVDFLTHLLKENVQDLSALMILDDVSGDDCSSLVEKLVIPGAENVKYLFTSQESRGWLGFDVYKIDRITVAIAEEIMAKRIGVPTTRIPEADKDIVLEIVEATEFHPIVLASVAAAVQPNDKGGVDPSEWKEVKKNLLFYLTDERGVDIFGKSYPRSVFAAMMFAVQVLHREDKILFKALCILALFGGPFPKKVPLLLLLSIKSTLSKHFIRFMKELESRGFVETVAIRAESSDFQYPYCGEISVSVPSCKMHSLRQQFMLLFLREEVVSFKGSSVEFRDSVNAVQEIISPFLNEASEGRDSNTTVASMSAALCTLYGAQDVKEKASSRLPTVANLLGPEHILKANLGMLMMDIEHDSDSTFLLEVQRVVWKYIVEGEMDDVSMANLIVRPNHKALLFFSLHVTARSWLEVEREKHSLYFRSYRDNPDWIHQEVISNRKSLEAVFGLLSSSSNTTEDEFQVQMFVLHILGSLRHTKDQCPSLIVFRDILVFHHARVDSIKSILTKVAEYVNASPLIVSGMESTEDTVLRGEDAGWFEKSLRGQYYYGLTSSEVHFRDSVIVPVQTILSAVKLLHIYASLECDETGRFKFNDGLDLIESISKPLLCIARILGPRVTHESSTIYWLAMSVLELIVEIDVYTDKRGMSSMDFMPNAWEEIVSRIGEGHLSAYFTSLMLRNPLLESRALSSHLISVTRSHLLLMTTSMLTNFIKRDPSAMDALGLHLFEEWDDMTGMCSAHRQHLSKVLFTVLSELNEAQGVEGWTELGWKISTYLLLLGHPLEYHLDSCAGIGAIHFQLYQSKDVGSCATKLLDGFDSLFDIIQDSQCELVQVAALKIMTFLLERCPKVGARSIFWRSRAVEALAPLLEKDDEKMQELALEILLSMPCSYPCSCSKEDTSYRPLDGYSCMRHIESMSGVSMRISRYFKYCTQKVGAFFAHFFYELKGDGVACLSDISDLVKDIVCVLREGSKGYWVSSDSRAAIQFLSNLVRYDRSNRVCSELVTQTELIEMLASKWEVYGVLDVNANLCYIFHAFTLEQRSVILTNPAIQEIMQSMILSLQNSGQSIAQFARTLRFLHHLVKEESGVEHFLSYSGSVEAVVGFLVRARKEQVESCSRLSTGIEKERRKVLAVAVGNSSAFLNGLVMDTSQQGRNRIFGIRGFVDIMMDLLDEEQVEETQKNVLDILWFLSGDPEQQDKLLEFMENHLFHEKCSKLLLSRLGRRMNIRLGNIVITEIVRSLVSHGLQELVCRLDKSDNEQEQQAFLVKLLLNRWAEGWVNWIQIGGYFLRTAAALDRLVSTSVYCQQESLRADALEILGICVCVLEDGKNPLQIGESQRQQQLQMILHAVPVILDQISVGGYGVFLRFLRRLGVDCKQSSSAILGDPKVVHNLIQLSIQNAEQEARGDALDCLHCFIWSFAAKVSNVTREDVFLLQELSNALASIACGTEAGNSRRIQNTVVSLLQNLIELASWKYLDESTRSLLSVALESTVVGDTHVLENLVALLEKDKPDVFCVETIDILLYAGENLARALDHVAQLPRVLERLVELFSGANEGRVQHVAFRFLSALIQKTTCKIRARVSRDLLRHLVHIVSKKMGEETVSRAVPLLVFCAVQNKKALSYLTGLLTKRVRSALRVDATVFLMKQITVSTRDPEIPLLTSLQTIWVRSFPGKDWESYFPGEYCSDSANLEPRVVAGLIWLSEISLGMQLRIAEALTGIHAGELVVMERDSAYCVVSRCMKHLFLLFLLQFSVYIGWR